MGARDVQTVGWGRTVIRTNRQRFIMFLYVIHTIETHYNYTNSLRHRCLHFLATYNSYIINYHDDNIIL